MRTASASTRLGSILIVDDDADVRKYIATVIGEAGYLTVDAPSGSEALRVARLETPSLVLLDVHMRDMCGYEVCSLLRTEFGDGLPIIFVSGDRTESYDRVAGLLIGANDYLVKPFSPDELLARVQALLRFTRVPAARKVASHLSPREVEVLRLLAAGLSPGEIARRLVLSPKTIGAHIEHIYTKLGVESRAQAVSLAYRDDLVSGLDVLAPIASAGSPSGDAVGALTRVSRSSAR
jgi:DNA-binding NarL/FixJ family response regulator